MGHTATIDPLLPRSPGGEGAGAAMALAAHGALIAALVWGLNWHAQAPDVVSAELWSAVPQTAAPAPQVQPPPAPAPAPLREAAPKVEPAPRPDPQIAIEQERKAKAARAAQEAEDKKAAEKKAAAEKAEKAEKLAAEKAAEAKLAKQREDNLRRMMGQIGASGAAPGTAARDAAPSAGYAGRLVAHIKPNIVFTESLTGNPAAEVEVRASASGSIIARRLVKSSGHKEWDEAVLRAIDRTGTLPRDVDGRVPSTLLIAFRPND